MSEQFNEEVDEIIAMLIGARAIVQSRREAIEKACFLDLGNTSAISMPPMPSVSEKTEEEVLYEQIQNPL